MTGSITSLGWYRPESQKAQETERNPKIAQYQNSRRTVYWSNIMVASAGPLHIPAVVFWAYGG